MVASTFDGWRLLAPAPRGSRACPGEGRGLG